MERYLTNKSTLRCLIYESIYQALCESSQDKAALTYLKSRGITDYNEQMKYIGSLQHDIPNLRLDKRKFMVGALRLYFEGELSNYENIESFGKVLNCISKHGHTGEYNFDLNGLSLSELYDKYDEEIRSDAETDRERSGQTQRGNGNGYKIIPINTFKEAEQYGEYTSWCVTHIKKQFNNYTKGGKRFYFCLKDGFEGVQRNDDGAPLNEYGLSMIAVLVDTDGNLSQITTRYNHEYGGENNDGLSKVPQLEEVLDVNFYKVFKPYTREELHEMGIVTFDNVQELLDSGKSPSEVFDFCYDFNDGFAIVKLNDKYNYIDENYKLLSNKWFDECYSFSDGFAKVRLNGKYNYIDKNCELLSPNQWFDWCSRYSEGFAKVELNYKYNYINTNGELVFNQWFDECIYFSDGLAKVKLDKKWNYINTNGEILSKNQWFDECGDFYNGFTIVRLGKKWNFIDTNGEIISPNQWFDDCNYFSDGLAKVKLDKKWNYIDTNGNYLSDEWLDYFGDFYNGFGRVKLGQKYNYIGRNGEILSPDQWFDYCDEFSKGFARVNLNDKFNYIDTKGDILSNQWFDYCRNFNDGVAIVKLNNEFIKINTNGEILNK